MTFIMLNLTHSLSCIQNSNLDMCKLKTEAPSLNVLLHHEVGDFSANSRPQTTAAKPPEKKLEIADACFSAFFEDKNQHV